MMARLMEVEIDALALIGVDEQWKDTLCMKWNI
jgi:hypothetical protein